MRRSIKYGLYAAVLSGVLGSTIAWASVDKIVTVEVDGQSTQVHTVASNVKGALADAGYKVGDHDIVAPSVDTAVKGGSKIVLERGRLLQLTIDGSTRDVWVTAPTVADALHDLGYESADLNLVSRSNRLPLSPTQIMLSTPKSVTLTQGAEVGQLVTTEVFVGDLLRARGVTLGPDDTVSPPMSDKLVDGTAVVVKRMTRATVTGQAPVPYATTQTPDATLNKGTTTVVTKGAEGVADVVYSVVYVDGVESGRTVVSSTTVTAPKTQVEKVGTKTPPPAAPAAAVTVDVAAAMAIGRQVVAAHGWGDDQYNCLALLWGNESGWRVNAANSSGAYGIPQALPGSKMASAGADWQTNAATQIAWGMSYITGRYGTPCGAWSFWQGSHWY